MTDYKVTLKSNISTVELNKKKVKVTCANNNAGKTVMSTLTQNSKALLPNNTYDISKGIDAKDFNVKFDSKGDAEAFYNKVMDIMNDASIKTEQPEESKLQQIKDNISAKIDQTIQTVTSSLGAATAAPQATAAPTATTTPLAGGESDGNSDNGGSKKTIIIAAAAAVVLLLVVVLVMKKK